MEHLLAAIKKSDNHHSALPFADVPQFVIDLRRVEGVPARALEFLVLTGMRTGAILKARWSEFDLPIWHIPAERMKGNKEGHRVPLSQPALDLLAALPRDGSGYVFIGARRSHIHKGSMIRILQKLRPDATVHGFRSAFTDWAHETHEPPEAATIDMALAHTIGDKVEAAYRRGDLFVRRLASWKTGHALSRHLRSPSHRSDRRSCDDSVPPAGKTKIRFAFFINWLHADINRHITTLLQAMPDDELMQRVEENAIERGDVDILCQWARDGYQLSPRARFA